MGKHCYCYCVIGVCDMRYPELCKKHNNVDGDIVTHKSRKDGAVTAGWIKSILKGRKQVI